MMNPFYYTKFAIFLYTYTEVKLWIELVFPSVWRSVENDRPTQRGPGSCQPRSQGFGFVIGSLLVPRAFLWILWFYLLLQKNSISKFQIDQDRKPTRKLANSM